MTPEPADVLLVGYGNPGRLDDGLGAAMAVAVEALDLPGVTVEANYQLTLEDAAEVARHQVVVFADADVAGPEPFSVRRLEPGQGHLSFSTHSVSPGAVLALARELFGADPEAWLFGIRGHEFNEFGERLSDQAEANLAAAVLHFQAAVRAGAFQEVRPAGRPGQLDRSNPRVEDDRCKTEST